MWPAVPLDKKARAAAGLLQWYFSLDNRERVRWQLKERRNRTALTVAWKWMFALEGL